MPQSQRAFLQAMHLKPLVGINFYIKFKVKELNSQQI